MEMFTLLLITNVECKCNEPSTHILIGKENEFIGFYCNDCGNKLRDKLESKFQFDRETEVGKNLQILQKEVRRKKRRQRILRVKMQIPTLERKKSKTKIKFRHEIKSDRQKTIDFIDNFLKEFNK